MQITRVKRILLGLLYIPSRTKSNDLDLLLELSEELGCTSSWFLTLQKCGFQQNKPEDLSVLQQCLFLGGDPDVVLLTGVPGRQRPSVCRGKKQTKN